MANQALQLTGQFPPDGRIPFLRRDALNTSKKQPLIVCLHGQGQVSNVHNTTSVLSLQTSGAGLPLWLTNSANGTTGGIIPEFTHPITGESFDYNLLAPQLWGASEGEFGRLWDDRYITTMIDYGVANMNVDPSRVYLTGWSLGAGGTFTGLFNPEIRKRVAAAVGVAPGYGNISTGDHQGIARSGIPTWLIHAADDGVAGLTISQQIWDRIRTRFPLVQMRFDIHATGGHGISFRMYDTSDGDSYTRSDGTVSVHDPGFFRWLLLAKKNDPTPPFYYVP